MPNFGIFCGQLQKRRDVSEMASSSIYCGWTHRVQFLMGSLWSCWRLDFWGGCTARCRGFL